MKVLLIGWDAAGWPQLHPLLERGQMPHLQQLLSRGSGGELHGVRPFESAALWTSIATGKRPTKHRVLSDFALRPDRTGLAPIRRPARMTAALWDILSHHGLRTNVINWPVTHPPDAINGLMISDAFLTDDIEGCWVTPAAQQDILAELRLTPDEVDPATLSALNPALPTDELPRLRRFVADAASVHAAATSLLEREAWDFVSVRYPGLPLLGQSAERTRAGAYRFFDMMLGRLLELAGPEASVLLVSEQGAPVSQGSPGIAAAAGPGFVEGRLLMAAGVCDVAPTILQLFNIPRGADMDGFAWTPVMTNPGPVAARPTWEDVAARSPRERKPTLTDRGVSPAWTEAVEMGEQRRLAEAWADAGEHELAARAFEALVKRDPSSIPYRSGLAEAYFRAHRRADCRRVIESLRADGVNTPLLHVGLAALDLMEGRRDAARMHLQQATTQAPLSAEEWEAVGQVSLRLHDYRAASKAFEKSVALRPEGRVAAHNGRARIALIGRDPESAERHARQALAAQPRSFEAHYHLARALARQKRNREAAEIIDAAALINPTAAERLRSVLDRHWRELW